RAAGENPVARPEYGIELGFRDVDRLRLTNARIAHAIHREASQAFSHVAPRVEVPVLAVVHEPLRRDLALGLLVARAAPVAHEEPLAIEERARGGLEFT